MLKIGFRVDANSTIGTGHLIEVISLINMLRDKIEFTPIVITTPSSYTKSKLRELEYCKVRYLTENISERKEAEEILAILKDEQCNTLAFDLLRRSNNFYSALLDNSLNTCIIIDLDDQKERPASIVVNFAITQEQGFYKNAVKYKTKYLVGPKYFPLDSSIKSIALPRAHKIVNNIFISQGGSDPFGLTAKTIRALEKIDFSGNINVILGGAMSDERKAEIDELKSRLKGNYNFYSNLSQIEFYKLLAQADLAVTSPGNTIYEISYLGIPVIIISHHTRHNRIGEAFAKNKAVINLGIGRKINELKIASCLTEVINDYSIRLKLSQRLRGIVDGGGCERIANELIKTLL